MSKVREYHYQALELVTCANEIRSIGQQDEFQEYLELASFFEEQAAELISPLPESEPTRSILYYGAASLAYEVGDLDRAERLVAQGLRGYPKEKERNDLKELYEKVNFEYHLKLRSVVLDASEFQLSVVGDQVGPGYVPASEFTDRVSTADKALKRTCLRKAGKEYTPSGKHKSIYTPYETILHAPRAASFAVSVKLLRPVDQIISMLLPEAEDIIDEFLLGLDLVNENKEEELKILIPDEKYYLNFISQAKLLAPDGKRIRQVGFTSNKRRVSFTRKRDEISLSTRKELDSEDVKTTVNILGRLDYASAKQGENTVGLTDENKNSYLVAFAEGLEDFVRSYFGKHVRVSGLLEGKTISNAQISPAEDTET